MRISDGGENAIIPQHPPASSISDSNRGIVAPIDSPVWAQIYRV